MDNFRESKEEIKNRMIRTALDYWNIKKVENLDPFIRLLIEALSMQLHYLSNDIADIEVRAMRRLSEVLLPEVVTVARPSHAILHVNMLMDECVTTLYDGFSAVSPFAGQKDLQKFSFYPVCRTKLRKGNIKKMIVEGDVYDVLEDQNKQLLLKNSTIPECVNKIFLGIDLEGKSCDLQNLSFYFDFPNVDGRQNYLHSLSNSQWKKDGVSIRICRGLFKEENALEEKNLPNFFKQTRNDYSVNQEIFEYYRENYVTIDQTLKVTEDDYKRCPSGYISLGYPVDDKVFSSPLLWLEVSFPPQFTASVLSDIQVSINTFPVANKEWHHKNTMVKKDFGVLPLSLEKGECFFDVVEVSDDEGRIYRDSYGYKENPADLYYTLRQGGCESFDQRSAQEYLARLQNLLEDELSVFSSSEMGNNSESVYLVEDLLQKMNRMTNYKQATSEVPYYLFVEPQNKSTYFYTKYWTTYGPQANGMRIGVILNPMASVYGYYEQPTMLTNTVGGRAPLSEQARIAKFKYILGSRNRIVTNNDIRNYCFSELSDFLADVRIEKGMSIGSELGTGIQRTIDVHLVPNEKGVDEAYGKQIKNELYCHLKEQSPMTYNYRIFID